MRALPAPPRFAFRARLLLPACVAATLVAVLQVGVRAQVRGGPVRQGSGPVSELSTNVGAGSRPVHQRGRSVRDGSAGRLGGRPVRGSTTGNVLSGPVSDLSVGPVTARQPVAGSGTMTDASAGAVKKDIGAALGERITQPLRELGPLQERLRTIQPLPRDVEPVREPFADDEAAAAAAARSASEWEEPYEAPEAEAPALAGPAAAEGELFDTQGTEAAPLAPAADRSEPAPTAQDEYAGEDVPRDDLRPEEEAHPHP